MTGYGFDSNPHAQYTLSLRIAGHACMVTPSHSLWLQQWGQSNEVYFLSLNAFVGNFGSIWSDSVVNKVQSDLPDADKDSNFLWWSFCFLNCLTVLMYCSLFRSGRILDLRSPLSQLRKSQYQHDLASKPGSEPPIKSSDVRYWADFNRVYYSRNPQSIHTAFPDPPLDEGGQEMVGNWSKGVDAFQKYDEVWLAMFNCELPEAHLKCRSMIYLKVQFDCFSKLVIHRK